MTQHATVQESLTAYTVCLYGVHVVEFPKEWKGVAESTANNINRAIELERRRVLFEQARKAGWPGTIPAHLGSYEADAALKQVDAFMGGRVDWLPISSAPKDQSKVLVLCGGEPMVARYLTAWGGWANVEGQVLNPKPTHWKPITAVRTL